MEELYPQVSPELEEIRNACLSDLAVYSAYIHNTPIQPFHEEWCDFWTQNRNSLILAPRGSLKSTILTRHYIEWQIAKNFQIRVLVCCAKAALAWGLVRETKGTFEGNDRFIELFGDLVGKRCWSRDKIDIKQAKPMVDNTLMASGIPGALTMGMHPDLRILDDPIGEDTVRTPDTRKKIEDWVFMTFWPMRKPSTQTKVVGTRYHPQDLYGTLVQKPIFENTWKRYKAIKDDGQSFWPEWFPMRARKEMPDLGLMEVEEGLLDLKENMGTSRFNAQYQNDIDMMKGDLIQEEWLNNFWYENGHYPYRLPTDFYVSEGCDLAISEKDTGKFFVWMRLLIDKKTSNVYVESYIRGRFTAKQQKRIIVSNWQQGFNGVRADRVWIEAHAYEASLSQEIMNETVVPVKKIIHNTTGKIYERTIALQPLCENGKLFMHPKKHERLRDELLEAPRGDIHDCVDALYNAFQGVRQSRTVFIRTDLKPRSPKRIFLPQYGEYPPISLIKP